MRHLATDLDGTLIPPVGDEESRKALEILAQARHDGAFEIIYVSGRSFGQVLQAIEENSLPMPDWIACDVGTDLYRRRDGDQFERFGEYHDVLREIVKGIDADTIREQIQREIKRLRLQSAGSQTVHKLSYYCDASQQNEAVSQLERLIEREGWPLGVIASVCPIEGTGMVDVVPRGASKAMAVDWWCREKGIAPEDVIYAGDSGNDYAALVAGHCAILVGNADRSLAAMLQAEHHQRGWRGRLYLAEQPATAGVLEGARWFGLVPRETPPKSMRQVPVTELHRWIGAKPITETMTRFCVWAPLQTNVEIVHIGRNQTFGLEPDGTGYHVGQFDGFAVGDHYGIRLNGGPVRPDPTSRFQPVGVHGPSEIVSHQFAWTDQAWRGRRTDELIIYELHLGTFTERGTYLSAIDRLDELVELGATAIELMPLNETAGDWNWGYDGVQLFAPRRSYGTPHEFRQLVNAAHRKGLAVIVDVVYNHFGPEGNYLGEIGAYLSAKHTTIWGAAPNLDEAHSVNLRRWMIANAIYWLDEFHCDGLRVDAIHCIRDDSQSHWVGELSKAIRQWGTLHGRHPLLIAEANVYDPEMTLSPEQGGYDFDAAWSDCFLHSVFGIVRPGEHLSHRRYESDDLARVLKQGFVFEGTLYRHRERADREHRVATQTLVYSLQNHDAIGNHPLGQRFHQLTSKETQRSAAALYLLAPSIPMLFMGEEFCSEHPFGFFVDFSDEALRRAVVAGRHAEYPQHDWTHSASPVERQAFVDSRIGPRSAGDDFTWRWYQALIALRKSIRQIGLLEERWLRTWSDVQRGFYTMCYIRDAIVVHVIARITRQEHNASVIPLEDSALKDPTVSKVLLDSNESSFGLRDFAPNHAKVIANRHGLELIGIG